MYVRVVRFTGVTAERMQSVEESVKAAGGPPPGVSALGVEFLYDQSQGTVVVLQRYETAADMQEAARIFDAMDTGETPGARASVDTCELRMELKP